MSMPPAGGGGLHDGGVLECILSRELHPEKVSRIPRTPSGVRMLICLFFPGVRKKRVPLA